MSPIDEFLQAVEGNLRGPARNRPEVLEELQGHLQDRAAALVKADLEPIAAEKKAISEMGWPGLLALRLSFANGWNFIAEILWGIWTIGIALWFLIVLYDNLGHLESIINAVLWFNFIPRGYGPFVFFQWIWQIPQDAAMKISEYANFWSITAAILGFGFSLGALAAFAFSLSRLRRSWLWAVFPGLLLFLSTFAALPENNLTFVNMVWLAVAVFFIAALLGAKNSSPRLAWLPWIATGVLFAAGLTLFAGHYATGYRVADWELSLSLIARQYFRRYVVDDSMLRLAIIPWVFWLAARLLEQRKSSSIARA